MDKQGVNNEISYSVTIEDTLSDVNLWRIIINGHPYKTLEELGCNNKEEAFQATKQAIYCYLYGYTPSDYVGIGEAGNRALNALKKILENASKSTEIPNLHTVKIIKEQNNFGIDSIEDNYVSKVYSIKSDTDISNYSVEINNTNDELPIGMKITDIDNNEKQEFLPNEKFKILIPIRNLTKDGEFNIKISTKANSKPILYGKPSNASYQDYALTASIYEDTEGYEIDKYFENLSKIKIIKKNQDTNERLENVEFDILDSNKNIMFSGIKTNEEGEINISHLIPGKYYIKEKNPKPGYILDDQLIEFNIKLNENLTITINNIFEENIEPAHETNEIEENIIQKEIVHELVEKSNSEISVKKKLPITGM